MAAALNRIPAAPIVETVVAYLSSEGDRKGEGVFAPESVYLLAERADIRGDTLEKILSGRSKTIDFDLADRLLCAMNLSELWLTDLAELYQEAALSDEVRTRKALTVSGRRMCARRTCTTVFAPARNNPHQRYCSSTCQTADWKVRNGKVVKIRGKGRVLDKLECRKGHPRSAANTRHTTDGRIYCTICKRKVDRDWEREHYVPVVEHASKTRKLTADVAALIRSAPGTQAAIAKRFGVSKTLVSNIRTGKSWASAA